MDTIPIETFQLVCSFCSLHALANLRLVSKGFRDSVDGSLTARRAHAVPESTLTSNSGHDAKGCYVRLELSRLHSPITAVFDRYSPQHNYLEFVQQSPPTEIYRYTNNLVGAGPLSQPPASGPDGLPTHYDFTLGRLDLNLWEQQLAEFMATTQSSEAATTSIQDLTTGSHGSEDQSAVGRRGRRSSITQASIIRSTEHQIEQELSSRGPITPLSSIRPIRNALSSSFGTSSASTSSTPVLPRESTTDDTNYMARFARMVLGSTGAGPQTAQTRPGMTAAELVEEARQLIHTVEPEVLSSKKQYKFLLSEGVHYVGDDDFIMRYTMFWISSSRLMLNVDYIRVSWKWITSGVPATRKGITEKGIPVPMHKSDPTSLEDPFPQERIGRMYGGRFNRLLRAIKNKEISHHIRGELALNGYDASVLSRDYISVNLWSEPVLAWITREEERHGDERDQLDGREKDTDNRVDGEQYWVDLSGQSITGKQKGKADTSAQVVSAEEDGYKDQDQDQAALAEVLLDIKQHMGFLTVRNILEEMLAEQGYPRELVWKYGIVRREMMARVPEVRQARQLLQKIVDSEAASRKKVAVL